MLSLILILLAVACPAHANWIDDAAKNLATDLAPFLSLFGEKMLLHWISQSVTYFEVLVIAICPIGVPALIVSAIRLAGSRIMKNVIGRPRESRPAVESELTPSTSDEVSECWDGHRVVRTIGDAKTQEYFVLKRAGASSTDRIVVKKLSECVGTYIEVGDVPAFPGKMYQVLKSTFNSFTRRLASINLSSLRSAIGRHTRRSSSPSDVEHSTVPLEDISSRASGSPQMPQGGAGDDAGVILIKNDKTRSPNLSLNIQEHLHPKFGDLHLFLALAVALLVMTGVRYFINNHLASHPSARRLTSGFEMDWLSMTMAKGLQDAPWSQTPESTLHAESDSSSRPWAANGGWDWKAPSWEDLAKCVPLIPDAPLDSTPRPSKAQEVLNLRKGIANAGATLPPLTTLAVSVARAIEGTLNTLATSGEGHLEPGCSSLLWRIGGHPDDIVEIRINFDDKRKKWHVPAGDLEAMLSLWSFKTSCRDEARGTQLTAEAAPVGEGISTGPPAGHASVAQEDEWLRAHSQNHTSLYPMPLEGNPLPALFQEINLWFSEPFRDTRQFGLIALEHGATSLSYTDPAQSSDPRLSTLSSSGLPGKHFVSLGQVTTLVQEPEDSLQTSLAQHLFSLFMWSLAKTLKKPIGGEAEVTDITGQTPPGGSLRTRFALDNSCLREISTQISLAGLGEQGAVFPSLLLPLLVVEKVPSYRAIVETAVNRNDRELQRKPSDTNIHVGIWSFWNLLGLPSQKDHFLQVASVLMNSLVHMHADHGPDKETRSAIMCDLTSIIEETRSYIGDSGWKILKRVVSLSKSHDARFPGAFNSTSAHLGLEPTSEHSGNTPNPGPPQNNLPPLHHLCLDEGDLSIESIREVIRDNKDHINTVDIFGRAVIHYAVQMNSWVKNDLVNLLVLNGAKVDIPDLLGRTPVHLAAHCPGTSLVMLGDYTLNYPRYNGRPKFRSRNFRSRDQHVFHNHYYDQNYVARDSEGLTPLHHAIAWGEQDVKDWLLQRKQRFSAEADDGVDSEVVHYCARYGEAREVIRIRSGLMNLHDNFGRSGFHMAVINPNIMPEHIPDIFRHLSDFDHRDSFSETPLDLAKRMYSAGCGHACSSACESRMKKAKFYSRLEQQKIELRILQR
ncbi:unnamed protein product [Clonostachys byssicola]|uniref:Ankyrin repeat protein n=1 Tax=Clonostachys byssicola TaxID=160290 RepID=A0A9N9Y7P4_9HYPO|nr:unnamed protein product [Clonostachys byssicola]